uniref:Uncharacterized protein n=1 Tax=Physcomitrium patens TaxID=3218 RepID=A0A2K1KJR1_PHYPA|nr:hypothetical protein PHYPA_007693 [Physcomitrium patens]
MHKRMHGLPRLKRSPILFTLLTPLSPLFLSPPLHLFFSSSFLSFFLSSSPSPLSFASCPAIPLI